MGVELRLKSNLQTLIMALVVLIVGLGWVHIGADGIDEIDRIRHARALRESSGHVDKLLLGVQDLAFERGRSHVVLRGPDVVSDANRAFLAQRRKAGDDQLLPTLTLLDQAGSVQAGQALRHLEQIRGLRVRLDQDFSRPRDQRDPHLPPLWLSSVTQAISAIESVVVAQALHEDHFPREFRLLTRIKLQALALRNAAGQESSRIALLLNGLGPTDFSELGEIYRLRGEVKSVWDALGRDITILGSLPVAQAREKIETSLMNGLRGTQENILNHALQGRPMPLDGTAYTQMTVAPLDSIGQLIQVATQQTNLAVDQQMDQAVRSLTLHLFLALASVALGSITIMVVRQRLLAPLDRLGGQLRRLAQGEALTLPPLLHAHDEFGQAQNALLALRQAQAERDRMATEIALQRERLNNLINAIPDFVCLKDGDGHWLISNEVCQSLFGLQETQVVGRTSAQLARECLGDAAALKAAFDADQLVWEQGQVTRRPEVVVAPDGTPRFFDVIRIPLFHDDGRRKAMVVVGRDITDRHRIEAALGRLSRQNELILECAGEGIIGLDLTGKAIFANPAAARMTGYDIHEIIDTSHHQLLHHTHADGRPGSESDCPVLLTLADGQPRHVADDTFWRKDGTALPVEFSVTPMVEQGQVKGAVMIFRDVSDKLHASHEIQTLLRDLRRSNADLEQFAYAISHDLQEPLRMVSAYVTMLDRRYRGQLDQDADEFIRFAVDGAKRMSAMINALLEFARVGTRGEAPSPTDMNALLAEITQNLAPLISESRADLLIQPNMPWVMADPAQLTSLLQNLLINAVKYRHPDRRPMVSVSACFGPGMVTLAVTDNGMGIAPDNRERVFGVFQRLSGAHGVSGTGMGLAICRRIVERLGGTLWIEDNPSGGSVFKLNLPTVPEELAATLVDMQ